MIGKKTWLFGALALAAAAPAYGAPSGAIPLPPSSQPPQSTPPTTQPAPPPATPPATSPSAQPAPAPAPAGAPQASADAKSVIEKLHTRNVADAYFAKIAQERGSSQRIKDLGRELQSDAEKLDHQLEPVAKEHGVALASPSTITDSASVKQSADMLRSRSGADFDRFYAETTAGARLSHVDELKAMRDQTPGKDSSLKKYLDDYENVMEQHRNDARTALKDATNAQQRQGRTPGR